VPAAYWLLKSEPDVFSIDDLRKKGSAPWDGVRNYTARNFLRDGMKKGDLAFFYHSSCPEPGIAGIMQVGAEGYPDPSQFDPKSKYYDPKALPAAPRWFMVDLKFRKKAAKLIPLSLIRATPGLRNMALIKLGRLSVSPVQEAEWKTILGLKGFW
jgi:predicted RNA-binding protein with PUA-like domain